MSSVASIDFGALSPQHFREAFVKLGVPVLLRGFLSSWPACRRWTPASFALRFASVTVEPMRNVEAPHVASAGLYRAAAPMTMPAFVDSMNTGAHANLYLVAHSQILRKPTFATLWDDMVFDPQWLDAERKETGVSFWMGPAGARTPLHFDLRDTLLAQAYGHKRVILFDPKDTQWLYPGANGYSAVDVERADAKLHPLFSRASICEATLESGDALFLPHGWWHDVKCLSASVSLSLGNFAWAEAAR